MDLAWLVGALRDVHFRGKIRLVNRLAPRGGVRQARLFGYLVDLDLGDLIQRNAYLGTYEQAETAIVRRHLRPGGRFLDVGANIGYFSLMAASIVGESGRVIAIEPSPYAGGELRKSIERNRLSWVKLHPVGLADEPGEADLFVGGYGNHSPTFVGGAEKPLSRVPLVRLDDLLARESVDRIDLMKIDVEGYETKALRGARASLRGGVIRNILCEVNDPWLRAAGSSPAELVGLLREAGFRIPAQAERIGAGQVENLLFEHGG